MHGLLFFALSAAGAPVPLLCDREIGEVETMALRMEACARFLAGEHAKLAALASAKPSRENRGLPDTRTWSIPADASSPAVKKLVNLAVTEAVRPQLIAHFAYTAFAAGDPSLCDKLDVVDQAILCRHEYGNLRAARAAQGAPGELVEACRLPQRDTAPGCCDLIAKLPDRSNPCASLVPGCWSDAGMCRAFWDGEVNGDAKACPGARVLLDDDCKADGCRGRRTERVARCVEVAAFARAFKAKDIGLCGDSARCRALMGEAPAVAAEINAKHLQNPAGAWFLKNGWKPPPLPVEVPASTAAPRYPAADYRGFLCADPIQSLDNRKAAGDVLEAARSCLDDLENTDAIDERDEKLARLSLRLELTFSSRLRLVSPDL